MISNSDSQWGWMSRGLHWLGALMVFCLFALGFWMIDLDYYSGWYRTAPMLHMSFGVILFALTVWRLIWHRVSRRPRSLNRGFKRTIEKTTHFILYALLLLTMLSGYLIFTADGRPIPFFNWLEIPALIDGLPAQEDIAGDIHELSAYLLIALVLLHAVAALWHHFFARDNTLRRMLR